MELHNRLREFRVRVGKSQLQFAKDLGVSGTAYKNYERGVTPIPSTVVLALCHDFDVSPAWLFLGDGDPTREAATQIVKSAVLAARTFAEECGLDLTADQEVQLICKMFDQFYFHELKQKKLEQKESFAGNG
jgi:transcriptional regulator with XRE-family HTH domain